MIDLPGLRTHIAEAGAAAMVWGVNDCCLFVADWVRIATALDPAVEWRGGYVDRRGAMRLLRRRGGLLAVVSAALDDLGLPRTDDPLTGDVGVVTATIAVRRGRTIVSPVAAIRIGRLWAVKGAAGMVGADLETIAAWRIVPNE